MTKYTWAEVRRARNALEAMRPDLFSLDNPTPLKIGISDDLAELFPGMPGPIISKILNWITRRRAYLIRCTPGAPRMGFSGQSGIVTDQQAAWAKKTFETRNNAARDKWDVIP